MRALRAVLVSVPLTLLVSAVSLAAAQATAPAATTAGAQRKARGVP